IQRLYWYEFPPWWRRQLALRSAGQCPDWAHLGMPPTPSCGVFADDRTESPTHARGLVVLSAASRDMSGVLADALGQAGYATVWQSPGRMAPAVQGACAGIWEGGQLTERESESLANFC